MKRKRKVTQSEVMEMKMHAEAFKKAHPGTVVIGANAGFGSCELCGAKNQELRPYGPKGENICYACGQKDLATTEKMMGRALFGDE